MYVYRHIFIIWVKNNIMSNAADVDKELIWSTWEELLLAFAVKRHGLKDWDTVAMELRNRHRGGSSSLPPTLLTAQICKNKYRNLRRRFTNHRNTNTNNTASAGGGGSENDDDDENDNILDGGGGGVESDSDSFLWLEELRKLRVAELKEEVHRYDLSIRTSQMKVKTMEEEREKSLREEEEDQNGDVKQPDLDEEAKKEQRSENDKNDDKSMPEEVTGKPVSRVDDDENMSFNESNSTENKRINLKTEPESEPAEIKSESESKPVREEVSCNDSSASQEREKGGGDSGELRDSVGEGESKEGAKESSDVQSSASLLTRKRKERRGVDGGGGGDGDGGDGAAVLSPTTAAAPIKREDGEGGAVKSEPSVAGFLDKIRSHKHGSVFERRLQSQKSEKYKSTIRRHVDLETVQARIDDGSYSSCPAKFYVDLLLLFTNAIVFFPKSSPESLAAKDLRQLVLEELKRDSFDPSPEPVSAKPKPKSELERSNSLLAQHKSTNPIIVSRKRSSISAKASSSSAKSVEKQQTVDKPVIDSKTFIKSPLSTSNDEQDSAKLKIKEKPVTGIRSMRRSSKGRPNMSKPEPPTPNSSNNKSSSSQQPSSKDKGNKVQAAKGDKKKSEVTPRTKKSGAADFLKRMKKNSPAKETLVESLKSTRKNSSKDGKKDQPKKKLDERKDGPVRRSGSGGGGGSRKHAKEESSSSKKSVGRSLKKEKDKVVTGKKRGREGGEGEGSSKRRKKRSR